jgi:hypothetical protein
LKESYRKKKALAWKSESRADRRGVLLEKGACFSAFKQKWRINHLCVMPWEYAPAPVPTYTKNHLLQYIQGYYQHILNKVQGKNAHV